MAEAATRLRPGSYKSVRFALELLTSHLGGRKLGDLNDTLGKEVLTASLVGHQSARSENKLTYGLYSAGISDTQKREIIDQVRLPQDVLL